MKLYTLGGYNEVGMNMTAVEVNNEIVIFDMGFNMEKVVESRSEIEDMRTAKTIEIGAVPNDKLLHKQRDKVKAIVVGHGHLDHCGAIPKLAGFYKCPIISTPYTVDIIKRLIERDKNKTSNEIIELKSGRSMSITPTLELEFIHITHSIPDTVLCSLNTVEGKLVYANDFKLDDEPTFGDKPDYKRIKQLSGENVKVFIPDTTHVFDDTRCPSEKEAQIKLKHTLNRAYETGAGNSVIVTTFSSHIARLRNIIKANNNRRKVLMLGRSLYEYVGAAKKRKYISLENIDLKGRRREIEEILEKANRDKDNYLIICTGNQGEENAVLSRIARGEFPLKVEYGDQIIFSCSTIPTPVNKANRYILENTLREKGVRMYKDIHSSGHAMREDHRDMIRMLNPENIVPAHGETARLAAYSTIAIEEGYRLEKDVHISQNGRVLTL